MENSKLNKKYSGFLFIAILIGIAIIRMFDSSEDEVIEASRSPSIASEIVKIEKPSTTMEPQAIEPTTEESATTTTLKLDIPESIQQLRREAIANLREIYVAEKVFHAEYNRYTSDLLALSFVPGKKEMSFRAGFIEESRIPGGFDPNSAAENPRRMDLDAFFELNQEGKDDQFRYSEMARDHHLQTYSHLCRNGCTADESSFEVLLVMPLGNDQGVDIWSINQDKTITLMQDGFEIKNPQY